MKCENDNNLKQLREIAGFTQEAAAEAIDVSPSTIQNWEYELIPLLKEYWFDEPTKVKDWSSNLRSAIK